MLKTHKKARLMNNPASEHTKLQLLPLDISYNLSIIIVSYNTKKFTLECVQSLIDSAKDYKIEIIVIDNGSIDGTVQELNNIFPYITTIESPENGGFSYGNNIGLMNCRSNNILLLNPDTKVKSNFVSDALRTLEKFPDAGAIGPTILNEDGSKCPSVMRYLRLRHFALMIFIPANIMRKTKLLGDFRYSSLDLSKEQNVEAISGCAILTQRKVIEEIGGLDHRIFMYAEELEWCKRIQNANYDVTYTPKVEVMHYGGASTDSMSEWKAVEMTRGHILFFRFSRTPMIAWIATSLMFFRDAIRLPFCLIKYMVNGFKADDGMKNWWARLKFEAISLIFPPKGQTIALPNSNVDAQ